MPQTLFATRVKALREELNISPRASCLLALNAERHREEADEDVEIEE